MTPIEIFKIIAPVILTLIVTGTGAYIVLKVTMKGFQGELAAVNLKIDNHIEVSKNFKEDHEKQISEAMTIIKDVPLLNQNVTDMRHELKSLSDKTQKSSDNSSEMMIKMTEILGEVKLTNLSVSMLTKHTDDHNKRLSELERKS